MVTDPSSYASQWLLWWGGLQPTWRNTEDWPYERTDEGEGDEGDEGDWGLLPSAGKDGLFTVIMSLAFLGTSVVGGDTGFFREACDDMSWALSRLTAFEADNGPALEVASTGNKRSATSKPATKNKKRGRTDE